MRVSAEANRLRQGYGGPPTLYAKAEASALRRIEERSRLMRSTCPGHSPQQERVRRELHRQRRDQGEGQTEPRESRCHDDTKKREADHGLQIAVQKVDHRRSAALHMREDRDDRRQHGKGIEEATQIRAELIGQPRQRNDQRRCGNQSYRKVAPRMP